MKKLKINAVSFVPEVHVLKGHLEEEVIRHKIGR